MSIKKKGNQILQFSVKTINSFAGPFRKGVLSHAPVPTQAQKRVEV